MSITLPDRCHHSDGKCSAGYVYVARVGDLVKIGYTITILMGTAEHRREMQHTDVRYLPRR